MKIKFIYIIFFLNIFLINNNIAAPNGPDPDCSASGGHPVDPSDTDSYCYCSDGSVVAQGVSCPLDTYVWVLLGVGGIYGAMKIRQNKTGIPEF